MTKSHCTRWRRVWQPKASQSTGRVCLDASTPTTGSPCMRVKGTNDGLKKSAPDTLASVYQLTKSEAHLPWAHWNGNAASANDATNRTQRSILSGSLNMIAPRHALELTSSTSSCGHHCSTRCHIRAGSSVTDGVYDKSDVATPVSERSSR